MVLSDKYGGKPRGGLLKRTLIYVLSFGLGALLVVGILSFTMVAIADGLLPNASSGAPTKGAAKSDGTPAGPGKPAADLPNPAKKPASKARRRRANEASKPKPKPEQPL